MLIARELLATAQIQLEGRMDIEAAVVASPGSGFIFRTVQLDDVRPDEGQDNQRERWGGQRC